MRVIAGRLGGRTFNSPKGKTTHPMSEKVRGALFAALGDISGLSLLDCYAGSGAVGFEAISRGASHVTAIEIDSRTHKLIQANAKQLGLTSEFKATRANCLSWAANNPGARFDLIVADPPYDQFNPADLEKLSSLLSDKGIFVVSHPGKTKAPNLGSFTLIGTRDYGDASLAFYRLP